MKAKRKRMVKIEFGVFQFCRADKCHFGFSELSIKCQNCTSYDKFIMYQKELGQLKESEIPKDTLLKMKKDGWL